MRHRREVRARLRVDDGAEREGERVNALALAIPCGVEHLAQRARVEDRLRRSILFDHRLGALFHDLRDAQMSALWRRPPLRRILLGNRRVGAHADDWRHVERLGIVRAIAECGSAG